jgi:murein DD-endopeptidase MepM/ murein hydrolase activator NlpD
MTVRVFAAAVLAAAVVTGVARAATFAVVEPAMPSAPLALPSFETPNLPGSLALPPLWTERAQAVRGLEFSELQALWMRAGAAYGIPWQVLAAINKIESNFGGNMGPSSAGAVGWMQFMPETWLRWGMDGNGDGTADPWDPEDAIFAAARYLAAAGGQTDLYRGVFAYNHADWYVRDVLSLAGLFGNVGGDVLFTLDRLGERLEQAEREVARTNERLVAALREEKRLARAEARLLARAEAEGLLSRALEVQKKATLLGVERAAAQARVAELRARLDRSEEELAGARQASQAPAFAPGMSSLLAAPAYAGGYVFPVGGGPAVVSASHDHHDYPAVDIAAPAGAPVYAFADLLVERAWHLPDARCGIGATLRTGDGREWTYCHLSYLEPGVQPGVLLSAGTTVGLVGSTGHSTGPHLHLQLQPPGSYPQDEPWFQSFAGSAFRWQEDDAPRTLTVSAPRPVFAVEEPDVVFFTTRGG